MSDVNYTLFKTLFNNRASDYQIQITTDFSSPNWDHDGYEVTSIPAKDGDRLKVKLKFKAGRNNHIIHDFSIGDFPKNFSHWVLEVEFEDENGVKIKENWLSEHSGANAHPRPGNSSGESRGMPRPPKK